MVFDRCIVNVLAFVALALGPICGALAISPPPPQVATPAPSCVDPGTPESLAQNGAGHPVHLSIAAYLQRRVAYGEHSVEFNCEGTDFTYRGKATKDSAVVESYYKQQGKSHATQIYKQSLRHGVTRTLWPNGKPQSIEYFFQGYGVGFHRYYDNTGQLLAVADHTSSDYPAQPNLPGRRTYITEEGATTGGLPLNTKGPMEVRKLQHVLRGQLSRVELQLRYGAGYRTLDTATRLEQLVTEGDQGWVKVDGRRLRLINAAMDYTPFWETYLRDRRQFPGADPVVSHNKEILASPWLDEAMKPPLPSLALPTVVALSDAQRQVSPRQRYLACLAQPSAECLLMFAVRQISNDQSHRDTFLRGAVAVALAVHSPTPALQALDGLFEQEAAFSRLNPSFAVPELLRAQVALLQGKQAQADEHAQRAYAHAQWVTQKHEAASTLQALAAVGPMLARLGYTDLAARAYEKLEESKDARSTETLGAIGLEHAKAGRVAEARSVVAQLSAVPDRYLPEDGRDAKIYSTTPRVAYAGVLAAIAERMAQRGDFVAAVQELERAQRELAKADARLEGVDNAQRSLALANAHMGKKSEAAGHLLQMSGRRRPEAQIEVVMAFCESGHARVGQALLGEMGATLPQEVTTQSAVQIAAFATASTTCGLRRKGLELFQQAKEHAVQTPFCEGDMCGGYRDNAAIAVANALVDAGQLDLLERWEPVLWSNDALQIAWAMRQARAGDTVGAERRLAALQVKRAQPLPPATQVAFLVAQAQVDQNSGRASVARLEDALVVARGIDAGVERGRALVAVAKAFTAVGLTTRSRAVLHGARASFNAVLADTKMAGIYYIDARNGSGVVAQELIAAGDTQEARRTADALLMVRGTMHARERIELLARDIEVELLAHQSAPGGLAERLRSLFALPASPAKAKALSGMDSAKLPPIGDYFDTPAPSAERRRLIALFAAWLRDAPKDVPRTQELERLALEARRLADPMQKARALCELGYTAKVLSASSARDLLDEGRLLAEKNARGRTFPLDPPATGACAYWLTKFGNPEAAATLMKNAVEPLRETVRRNESTGRLIDWGGEGRLLDLAIAVFEAENGEIPMDWHNGYWRP